MTFLAAVICLVLFAKRVFPSVYSGRTEEWGEAPFSIPDNYAIDVRNLVAASDWYKEKLGLLETDKHREEDSGRPFTDLHAPNNDAFLSLLELPPGTSAESGYIVFFARNLEKAQQWLSERGVVVEPIATDSAGNHRCRFQDPEGNTIDVRAASRGNR
jgi:catechol 2,3-dioxygenase-like lactoylglutathione lyase family enzyme